MLYITIVELTCCNSFWTRPQKMAITSLLMQCHGVMSRPAVSGANLISSSRRSGLGILRIRGTSSCSNSSFRRIGKLRRTICRTFAATRGDDEVALQPGAEERLNQVQEVGPSFRFMAEGNMWLLEFEASGQRVLADPWLVDNLTFWEKPWLYSGRSQSRQREEFPGELTWESINSVDAVIISQEWEDHCHIPTLKLLRKDITVIASPKAATIVQRLGFTDVRSVAHGTFTQIPGLQVWATVGGRVGPPWALRENGFVLQEVQTGLRIYYEPHCSFDEESIRSVSPVDVVITPGRQFKVAGFPLTESVSEAVRLLRILKPKLILPIQLTHLEVKGATAPILQIIGSVEDFESDLRKAGIDVRIAAPPLSGHFMRVQVWKESQAN